MSRAGAQNHGCAYHDSRARSVSEARRYFMAPIPPTPSSGEMAMPVTSESVCAARMPGEVSAVEFACGLSAAGRGGARPGGGREQQVRPAGRRGAGGRGTGRAVSWRWRRWQRAGPAGKWNSGVSESTGISRGEFRISNDGSGAAPGSARFWTAALLRRFARTRALDPGRALHHGPRPCKAPEHRRSPTLARFRHRF
jgi:hypothetical protein